MLFFFISLLYGNVECILLSWVVWPAKRFSVILQSFYPTCLVYSSNFLVQVKVLLVFWKTVYKVSLSFVGSWFPHLWSGADSCPVTGRIAATFDFSGSLSIWLKLINLLSCRRWLEKHSVDYCHHDRLLPVYWCLSVWYCLRCIV